MGEGKQKHMANQWFKFYGQEFLSDPKIWGMTAQQRSIFLTLLCLASSSDDGVIRFLTKENILEKSGVFFNPYEDTEWNNCLSWPMEFERLKLIKVLEDGSIEVLNWKKRQESALTVAERVAKHREKKLAQAKCNENVTECVTNVTTEENRIEENRIEILSDESVPSKTLKEYRNLRRKQAGKPPMTPRAATPKQREALQAYKSGIEYFKQKGHDDHGMQFLEHTSEKRNVVVRKLVLAAQQTLGDLKPLVDWWFAGAGEFAGYEPEACFSGKMIERFKNSQPKQPKKLILNP